MKLTLPQPSGRRGGYALILIMLFLAVCLLVFGSVMHWASANSTVNARNALFNQAEAAAESATEVAITAMQRDFTFGSLNSASAYNTSLPVQTGWPTQFNFSSTNGTANQLTVTLGTTNFSALDSQFTGLYGIGQTCLVAAVASPLNVGYTLAATISQQLWFGTIPIFQYAIFYNIDCEINPGAAMIINGRVHSNQNIWTSGASSSGLLTYRDVVEAALNYYPNRNPMDNQGVRTGNLVFLLATNGTYQNPRGGCESLTLPIGTNNSQSAVAAILGLPPAGIAAPNPAAYYQSNQIYFFNEADLLVSNAPAGGTNITVYYQNPNKTTVLTPVPPDLTNVVAGVTNVYYSYLTNVSFYDYRESDTVKALQIDVGQFNKWLTNTTATGGSNYNYANDLSFSTGKGHQINSIYVYNSIQSSATVLPAVRVVNGSQLPVVGRQPGLTVVTPQPLYVLGDYNITTNNGVTQALGLGSTTNNAALPAALIGDAITVLSQSWKDSSYTASTGISSRTAMPTTINAACLEGIVPTQLDSGGTGHYSGGVENFLRLLENWSNKTLTYNGSIVVMFNSQYATNYWPNTGTVYNPPQRLWGFDVNFKNASRLPPLTPSVKAMVRGRFFTH